jgi:hypothetical protein
MARLHIYIVGIVNIGFSEKKTTRKTIEKRDGLSALYPMTKNVRREKKPNIICYVVITTEYLFLFEYPLNSRP